jgi:hypothetical protein
MDTVFSLFLTDSALFKRWFSHQIVSRILVVLLFLAFFGFVAFGLYRITDVFFVSLSGFDHFGKETAGYIIHASLLIVFLLGIASAVISSIGLLLLPGAELTYLAILPVKPSRIVLWLFIKSIIANFILLSFAFIPIVCAYGVNFGIFDIGFIIRCLVVLILIVSISASISVPLALFVTPYIRGKEYVLATVSLLVFFGLMTFMLKAIFPPALGRLYDATASEYQIIFRSLPLNQWFIPTLWLSDLITDSFKIQSVIFILFTLLLVWVSIQIQVHLLWIVMTKVRSMQLFRKIPQSSIRMFMHVRNIFIYKDFLAIVRDPKESGYALFLTSVAVFFFVFLRYGTINQLKNSDWQTNLILFTYVWSTFFATSLFLRFLYPLFSHESSNAPVLFSLPLSRMRLLLSKIVFGIILSLPVFLFSVSVLIILPFTSSFRFDISLIMFWVILTLSTSQVLLGAINPNYYDGKDPEKVSTSGGGIISLIISGIVIYLGGYVLRCILNGVADPYRIYGGFIFLIIAINILLLLVAISKLRSYQFCRYY